MVYRWDLDKTYLRTEFDSIRDLLRTAVEPATRKRTVPGASVLLRELRATARAGALKAARAKAELYCETAGVKLGKVLHIEDINPTQARRGHGHMVDQDFAESADNDPGAYHPGAISVSGAVVVSFTIL